MFIITIIVAAAAIVLILYFISNLIKSRKCREASTINRELPQPSIQHLIQFSVEVKKSVS